MLHTSERVAARVSCRASDDRAQKKDDVRACVCKERLKAPAPSDSSGIAVEGGDRESVGEPKESNRTVGCAAD